MRQVRHVRCDCVRCRHKRRPSLRQRLRRTWPRDARGRFAGIEHVAQPRCSRFPGTIAGSCNLAADTSPLSSRRQNGVAGGSAASAAIGARLFFQARCPSWRSQSSLDAFPGHSKPGERGRLHRDRTRQRMYWRAMICFGCSSHAVVQVAAG